MSDFMLKQFEAWWASTPILKENKRTLAEKAWQASRQSQVVDLPKPIEAYGSQGHHASDPDEALILEDVHAALTAAGVKYK